jgi:exodeoxyribonuclease VII large subunit
MDNPQALTLLQLTRHISSLVTVPSTQNVWVTAELSDVATRGGHCYMELLEKDPERGVTVARMRAVIWANNYPRLMAQFQQATGQAFVSGIKVMVRGSVSSHPVYGMSLVVTGINPDFTLGDFMRRRREILDRLKREGIIEMNRSLEWPVPALRVAVVSAPGAAGYGDFINQLFHNDARLKFSVKLFPAVMQGERTSPSVIASLDAIAADIDNWDCVVVIRGGGATSDLAAFDDYDLAANIAQFPLPVIIGIGHERDVTVLDYVANMRVKTPTAAAQWLIGAAAAQLQRLTEIAERMARLATERMAGCKEHLSYYSGLLPVAPVTAIQRASSRLRDSLAATAAISSKRVIPALARLDSMAENLPAMGARLLSRNRERLDACGRLLEALSPDATLRRGYSITRVDGKAVKSAAAVPAGATVVTTLADGTLTSVVS